MLTAWPVQEYVKLLTSHENPSGERMITKSQPGASVEEWMTDLPVIAF